MRIDRPALAILAALLLPLPAFGQAGAYESTVRPVLAKYCFSCHGEKDGKAGLRLHNLGTDFLAGKNADVWKEVMDRMNLGEMPPKESPRPGGKEAFAVVEWVGRELKRAEREARMAGGRALLRRLNRDEYLHTVGDLLVLDPNELKKLGEDLPADGTADGFDRIASALFIDQTQLEKYVQVGGRVAASAIPDRPPVPARQVFETEENPRHKKIGSPANAFRKPNGMEIIRSYASSRKDSDFAPVQGVTLEKVVTQDGYYRIRIRGGADRGHRDEPNILRLQYGLGTPIAVSAEAEVQGTLAKPDVTEFLLYLRAGAGDQKQGLIVLWNDNARVIIGNPVYSKLHGQELSLQGQITRGIANRLPEAEIAALKKRLADIKAELARTKPPEQMYNPAVDLKTVPRLFLDAIEVEGPVVKAWPPASHRALGLAENVPETDAELKTLFTAFLPRAYRRAVTSEEVDRVVRTMRENAARFKLSPSQALRLGLQTVLASPSFLYMEEPAAPGDPLRPLTPREQANRLSYLLWQSVPDEALLKAAAEGTLANEIGRMIRDPKSRRFVESFAGQWLQVRDFGTVQPAGEYRDYDKALETASIEEPLAFFETVLKENLPISNFLESEFVVINERLARHYGIEGVKGPEFRKVAIRPEQHRGGVLGMAGLLTLLADGTRTLPVRRGAWIMDRLFNDPPPPPPPNAGEIQPNTAGANLSVRQRLEKHRSDATCASCHVKIDPLGLALENYDAIGAWRTKANGEGFRAQRAPAIDPSGTLPSGRTFQDLQGFKQALLAEKDRFRRAFAEKLLTYALARPVGYADRATIDAIVKETAAGGDTLAAMIAAVAKSEPFRTK